MSRESEPRFPPLLLRRVCLDWTHTCVMGVLNVTPDSFSDGGQYFTPEAAVAHGLALAAAGADLIDIGGESTRPGAAAVPAAEELRRVLPVISRLRERLPTPISIDTYKAEVANAALAAGAEVVNDISGLSLDPELAGVVARHRAALILGHMRGTPSTMQQGIAFADLLGELCEELRARVARAESAGVAGERILVDPCLGFGKTAEHNLTILRHLGELRRRLCRPLVVGPSRKAFIGAVTGAPVGERLLGTCAAVAVAVVHGADMVRLHDVAALRPAVAVADAIRRGLAAAELGGSSSEGGKR